MKIGLFYKLYNTCNIQLLTSISEAIRIYILEKSDNHRSRKAEVNTTFEVK